MKLSFQIFNNFLQNNFVLGTEEPDWPDGHPTDKDRNKCMNLHGLLKLLLEVVPM